jgi:CheY-like chemotaxis protein
METSEPNLNSRATPVASPCPGNPHFASGASFNRNSQDDRVLLVDDDPVVQRSILHHLQRAGYNVACSPNGKDALALLEKDQFAWLITDIFMPDLDGIELLQFVRRRFPALHVITMSGGTRGFASNYLRVTRMLGATHQLEKPFAIEQLLGLLTASRNVPSIRDIPSNDGQR